MTMLCRDMECRTSLKRKSPLAWSRRFVSISRTAVATPIKMSTAPITVNMNCGALIDRFAS